MNTKLSLSSALSSVALTATLAGICLPMNAQSKEAPRWFEVEVILFKQLGDKSLLKEQFFDTELPRYSRSFDLLTPYLQPDISALKQQLPYCDENSERSHALSISEKINQKTRLNDDIVTADLITLKSLSVIEEQADDDALAIVQHDSNLASEVISNNSFDNIAEENDNTENSHTVLTNAEITNTELNSTGLNITGLDSTKLSNSEQNSTQRSLSLTELAKVAELVANAEQHFNNLAVKNFTQYPQFNRNNLCQIPESYFQKTLSPKQLSTFNYNGFPVDSVPNIIDGIHKSNPSEPYLISKEALRLGDITQRLRWSKNFRPLLHLGWRQIGVTRNSAIPMKFYAGEHFAQQYQQKHAEILFQKARDELNQQNVMLENVSMNSDEQAQSHEELLVQAKNKQAFDEIFSQIESVDKIELSALLTQIKQNEQLSRDEKQSDAQDSLVLTAPIQPWFLDGFFKVHLDHYLYITADFNILGQQNKNSGLAKDQAIHFSQDQRVITGEVHYFDHPYIGMVVQIRRFDPTKPEDEAVTQAVR